MACSISFYAPFKPLDHPLPSGDLTIARGLTAFLRSRGHHITPVSRLRARWIYWKPWLWPMAAAGIARLQQKLTNQRPDIWLTYHTYYKAPDLIGPSVCRRLNLPYVIFQGIYSTKRRKRLKTWPGFVLNRRALLAANHVFTNRRDDELNLRRLLPDNRLSYIAPGIFPADFTHCPIARQELRRQWHVGDTPVLLTAAMFRADVKTQGLTWVIQHCAELQTQGIDFKLVIVGDGPQKKYLQRLAADEMRHPPEFVGQIARSQMHRFYSAADLFVFPGIRESLGMVYLEAQSCGLPVVAFDNGGIAEVVAHGHTGWLTPPFDSDQWMAATRRLLKKDPHQRQHMGQAAAAYVRQAHDLNRNYQQVARQLDRLLST